MVKLLTCNFPSRQLELMHAVTSKHTTCHFPLRTLGPYEYGNYFCDPLRKALSSTGLDFIPTSVQKSATLLSFG